MPIPSSQEEEKKQPGKKEKQPPKKVGKMKTREGKSVKLMDLLDEAKNRALKMFEERMKDEEDKV